MRSSCCIGMLALLAQGCSSTNDPLSLVVASFNTGTLDLMGNQDPASNGGWGTVQSELGAQHYGHGLAFPPVIEELRAFLAGVAPDVIGFQELYYSGDCPLVPLEARAGFVCETWSPGDPSVVEQILGAGYQIACHPGKNDKCIGIKKSFGHLRGCEGDFCLEGLSGAVVEGCGGGSRIGQGVIELADGETITVVNVHGSSGISAEDAACRVRQFQLVFEDLGDGQPAARGQRNLILGDFNTDPIRLYGADLSANEVLTHTGPGTPFHFVSEVGEDAPPTYGGLVNIDHLISDFAEGSCWSAGATPDHPPVTGRRFFDHQPLVCQVQGRLEPTR